MEHKQPLSYWLRLLYSPYSVLDHISLQIRGEAEKRLRKTSQFDVSPSQFLDCFEPADDTVEVLKAFIEIARNSRRSNAIRQNFSTWATYFQSYLERLEWPGVRSINSLEYQQRRQIHFSEKDLCPKLKLLQGQVPFPAKFRTKYLNLKNLKRLPSYFSAEGLLAGMFFNGRDKDWLFSESPFSNKQHGGRDIDRSDVSWEYLEFIS